MRAIWAWAVWREEVREVIREVVWGRVGRDGRFVDSVGY